MIVIDVGCAKWGGDESIPHLVSEFEPDILYGFDPGAAEEDTYYIDETTVHVDRKAAWTYDGEIGFRVAGLGGQVDERSRLKFVCFDLASFIAELDTSAHQIVLKMDAEGAEYIVLPHLAERGVDTRLKLAIIEWHCEKCGLGGNGRHRENCPADKKAWWERRNGIEEMMRCEMTEWNL